MSKYKILKFFSMFVNIKIHLFWIIDEVKIIFFVDLKDINKNIDISIVRIIITMILVFFVVLIIIKIGINFCHVNMVVKLNQWKFLATVIIHMWKGNIPIFNIIEITNKYAIKNDMVCSFIL